MADFPFRPGGTVGKILPVKMHRDEHDSGEMLWGIDLGGTKIEGAVLKPSATGQAIRLRRPTEAHLGYGHILSQIRAVVEDLEKATGSDRPAAIGIGTPGTTVPGTGTIKNSNTTCLNGRPLREDLSRLLERRVITANDANCFVLAEASLGAARGADTVFGIILGTGVGGGIVVDGRVLTGYHGICGEWGHHPLRGESTPCYCGGMGCLEAVCSGPALEKWYLEQSGMKKSLPEIVESAARGEESATKTLDRLAKGFAESLAGVVNLLDPDCIVIGGGVGNVPLLRSATTRELIANNLFNDRFETPLLAPALGDSAGVFGAAMLVASDNVNCRT